MGSITITNNNSVILTIKGKKDILYLIDLFNGNIFLKKRQLQFIKWVNTYNLWNKTNIVIKDFNFTPSLNDGWLAGFTDAEGSFLTTVSLRKDKRKLPYTVKFRYVLSQQDAKLELQYIADFINGYVEKSLKCDRIVVNYFKLVPIINYFQNFPLLTVKASALIKWLEIYNLMKEKKHLTLEGIMDIKEKAKLINAIRKI
jgi:hypothetical protein